jgi:hypothetical protein
MHNFFLFEIIFYLQINSFKSKLFLKTYEYFIFLLFA